MIHLSCTYLVTLAISLVPITVLYPLSNFKSEHSVKQIMGRKGVERHKPISNSVLECLPEFNACKEKFEGTNLYHFFKKIQGYDDEITLNFA